MDLNSVKTWFSNCVLYAVPKFIREGGYLIISWSPRNRYIPHFSWSRDLRTVEGFVPVSPKKGWVGVLNSPFFKGYVKQNTIDEIRNVEE